MRIQGVLGQYGFLGQGNRTIQKTVLVLDYFNTKDEKVCKEQEWEIETKILIVTGNVIVFEIENEISNPYNSQ